MKKHSNTIEKQVKKLAIRFWAGIFVVFILIVSGILMFSSLYYKNLALALSGTYTKSTGDSLLASEWNNLASEFVDKTGDTMTGDLTVNGFIRGNLDCTTVFGIATDGVSVATCGVDEFLLTGGGKCETGSGSVCPANTNPGFVHDNYPDFGGNQWVGSSTWIFCVRDSGAGDVLVTTGADIQLDYMYN